MQYACAEGAFFEQYAEGVPGLFIMFHHPGEWVEQRDLQAGL